MKWLTNKIKRFIIQTVIDEMRRDAHKIAEFQSILRLDGVGRVVAGNAFESIEVAPKLQVALDKLEGMKPGEILVYGTEKKR